MLANASPNAVMSIPVSLSTDAAVTLNVAVDAVVDLGSECAALESDVSSRCSRKNDFELQEALYERPVPQAVTRGCSSVGVCAQESKTSRWRVKFGVAVKSGSAAERPEKKREQSQLYSGL